MGFRLFFSFTLTVALLINAALPAQTNTRDKNDKRQIKRSSSSGSRSHKNRLSKTKESLDELAMELVKAHLVQLIANKHHKIEEVTKSIKTLEKDKCGDLKSVGKPVTHNTQQHTYGSWMKDPLGELGSEAIFVMKSYVSQNVLVEYQTMEKFKAGVPFKKYKLPYYWDGTGAVVYGPYLYYNRASSYYIVKYNILTQRVEAQIRLSSYYSVRRNYYQWSGYSGVDLAVDEQGLWAISGSTGNSYRPYVSKIDVVSNTITNSWSLSGVETMSSMGNAFMACGVFYAVDSYNSRTTTINYAYDTKTGRRWNPRITFVNQYGYNSMIDYNPREKVLYSWDNKRQVTYSLTFES